MTKVISLFNHKGGVSKTTTTFHLGWKMASSGKKVLIVDADPQCNLTGLTLGIGDYASLPERNPRMLGFISQNYRIYTTNQTDQSDNNQKNMSRAYQNWLDKIKEVASAKLIPSLKKNEMIISEEIFTQAVSYGAPYHLAGIQNFNTLIPTSQKLSKPIYELTQEDGKWDGAIWEKRQNNKEYGVKFNIEQADSVYGTLSDAVLKMMDQQDKLSH